MNSPLAAFVVCVSVSLAVAPWQAPARPSAGATLPQWAPVIGKHRLSNGLPVWIVEQHDLPVVQMSLVVRTGTAADPPGRSGMASLTAALLSEGAGGRSAVELADALDAHVANLSASTTADTSLLRLYVPVAGLSAVLPLMADMAQRPTLPAAALERARRQRLGTLRGVRDDPDAIAALAFARGLYGPADRNAAPLIGSAASLAAMTADEVAAFHASAYRPANSTLLVVGAVTPDWVLPLLESSFGGWRPAGAAEVVSLSPAARRRPERLLRRADSPGAPLAGGRGGGDRPTSPTADYIPMQMLNAVLRGRFGSDRTPVLREFSTGVRVGYDRRRSGGPLAVVTAAHSHKTAEALAEVLRELAGVMQAISPDELARARADVGVEFSRTFETTGRLSSRLQALETLVAFDLPDDYYATFTRAIQATSADDLRRVAAQYLHADHLVVAVAGDHKTIEPRLRALDLGSPTSVSIDDLFGPPR